MRLDLIIYCLLMRDLVLGTAYLEAVERGDAETAIAAEKDMVAPPFGE